MKPKTRLNLLSRSKTSMLKAESLKVSLSEEEFSKKPFSNISKVGM
jgi:hypothetical protein